MALPEGTELGAYRLTAKLGEGGMGEVYRAIDTRLGREVAIKVLPESTAGDADARARFEREARAIAALNHPNICTLHDVGHVRPDGASAGGGPEVVFLVMELLSGETLHQRLLRGPLPIGELLDHGAALADALDAAHSRGIIHRDLKPANIVLTTHGAAKILDFGLAKGSTRGEDATQLADAALTGPGTTIGTLAYMSPEQLKADELDPRSDLFSLGLVLYEMATGRRAFEGKTGAQVSAAILHETPASPSSIRGDLPQKLEDAILKALEKDRDLRYQSAAELRADLKRLKRQGDATGSTSIAATTPQSTQTMAPPAPSGSDAQVAAGLARRHPFVAAAAAIVVVAAVAGAWAVMNRPDRSASAPELTLQALTIDGQAEHATIAPDGKFIAYVRTNGDESSIVVKQIASNSDVVILPASDQFSYRAPSVTPDNSYVDVLRFDRQALKSALVRVPFLGGPARIIVESASSGVGWSPDGRRMAFIRFEAATLGTMLVVADAEGRNERVLQARKSPEFFSMIQFSGRPPARPSWSPDGQWVATGGFNSERPKDKGSVLEVHADSGQMRPLRSIDGFITEVAYRSDDEIVASVLGRGGDTQWWLYPRAGDAIQITRDLNSIADIQLTADRASGVATRARARGSIATGAVDGGLMTDVVAESAAEPVGAQLDQLGHLFYQARVPGSVAIMRSEGARAAGSVLAPKVSTPVPSPDGRFVIGSLVDGGLVRVNVDGSNPASVLDDPTASPVAVLSDGDTVAYVSNRDGHQRPWLLSLKNGASRRLSDTYVADSTFWLTRDERQVMFSTDNSTELCSFPAFAECRVLKVRAGPFSADGRTVYAIDPNDPKNLIAQPIDGGAAVPVTRFTDKVIADFSLSPDRRTLAITRSARESDVVLIQGLLNEGVRAPARR